MSKSKPKTYTITCTENQLRLISEACDTLSRIYRGIPDTCSIFDNVIIFRKPEFPDEHDRRERMAVLLKEIRRVNNPQNRTDGSFHSGDANNHDIHQVIRHEFWKQSKVKSAMTVDSSVHLTGDEPLIVVREIKPQPENWNDNPRCQSFFRPDED